MKISIITATLNCETVLENCLLSVASQSHEDIEHIVVDGASTDGTLKILKSHKKNLTHIISEPDKGIYSALNRGISLATGDIIGFLHADDFFAHIHVLSNINTTFEENLSISAVYGDLKYVSKKNPSRVIRSWCSSPYEQNLLAWGWMPPHPSLYVRREWYKKMGGFDSSYQISADYASILHFFLQPNFKSHYLPETFVMMRLGGVSNKSLRTVIKKTIEDWRALRNCGFNHLITVQALVWKNISKVKQFL